MSEVTSVGQIRAAAQVSRESYDFLVPPKLHTITEIRKITIVPLTADEEMQATRRAQNDPIRLAFELVKESVRAINDRPVGLADGSLDLAWNRMNPKIRSLVMNAYAHVHQPDAESAEAFIASRTVTVG